MYKRSKVKEGRRAADVTSPPLNNVVNQSNSTRAHFLFHDWLICNDQLLRPFGVEEAGISSNRAGAKV